MQRQKVPPLNVEPFDGGYDSECPAWLRRMAAMAFRTGLDVGELRELRWRNVNMVDALIDTRREKTQIGGLIPINGRVARILESVAWTRGDDDQGFVFLSEDGHQIPAQATYAPCRVT